MAAPSGTTLRNLSGSYTMNKQQSGDSDAVLKMQGMGWLIRQTVKRSNIVLNVKQYTDETGVVRIDIEQVSAGGFKSFEERKLDWEAREREDSIFGKVRGKTRFVNISEVHDSFLSQGWDQAFLDESNGEVIHAYVESVGAKGDQWSAEQVWGFEVIEGQRK